MLFFTLEDAGRDPKLAGFLDTCMDHSGVKMPSNSRQFKLAPDSGRKVAIAHHLAVNFGKKAGFLWISEHGIWPSCENRELFLGYRRSIGEFRDVECAPIQVFEKNELEQVESLLTLILVFCWGAFLSTRDQSVIIHISHDEIGSVYCRHLADLEKWNTLLDKLGV